MENYKNCFMAKFDGCVYIIPEEQRNEFDDTLYYDRKNTYSKYIVPDDVIFDSILIDNYDFNALVEGDLE